MPSSHAGLLSLFFSSSPKKVPHASTAIIFDYDDTLFPTTDLLHLLAKGNEELLLSLTLDDKKHKHIITMMKVIDASLCELFKKIAAKKLTPVIITNSDGEDNKGWAWLTAKKFLPNFHAQFIASGKIEIISARTRYEHTGVKCWKIPAFTAWLNSKPKNKLRELLNFGDSRHDRTACLDVCSKFTLTHKSIKFRAEPTINLLYKQLRWVHTHIDKLVSTAKPIDIELTNNTLIRKPRTLADTAASARAACAP